MDTNTDSDGRRPGTSAPGGARRSGVRASPGSPEKAEARCRMPVPWRCECLSCGGDRVRSGRPPGSVQRVASRALVSATGKPRRSPDRPRNPGSGNGAGTPAATCTFAARPVRRRPPRSPMDERYCSCRHDASFRRRRSDVRFVRKPVTTHGQCRVRATAIAARV